MGKRNDTPTGRYYEVEGKTYPSVTTILSVIAKPALVPWASKVEREMVLEISAGLYEDVHGTPKMSRTAWLTTMQNRLGKQKAAQKQLERAGEIGSQVHALVEWTLRSKMDQEAGPSPCITDKAMWAFMAWEDWRRSVHLRPLAVEQVVYSEQHGYAGTLDLLAEVEGVPSVIDWKTGKAIYSEAHLQNAAYRQAVREMGHGDPRQGLIVRLPKVETDPHFEVVPALPERACFDKFLSAMQLWTWTQEFASLCAHRIASEKRI
jgi:hypothetical protein